jgi:hypothetical protein
MLVVIKMLIESNNAQYFLKFYKLTLMNFAGKALNNASEFVPVRNKFYEKKNEKNNFFPKDADDDFRNGIKKAFYDDFIYLEKVRNGYLLRNEKQNKIYLVKAITTPVEEMIEEFSLIKTAILPFRGQIICDGLFEKHNILIGPNMMKELKEEIKEKRKYNEIIKEI